MFPPVLLITVLTDQTRLPLIVILLYFGLFKSLALTSMSFKDFLLLSLGNNCRFWQIFVEALEEFPNLFIQSKTSASTHEYFESNCASKCVMLLSNFGAEHRRLSPVSEAGFCYQLVLVPSTVLYEIRGGSLYLSVNKGLCSIAIQCHFHQYSL